MTMPDFTAGRRLRASELNTLADQIDSLTTGPWTDYTPTVSASGGGYSAGGATVTGRYRRAAGSNEIEAQIKFTCGATTNFGAGYMRFTLPVNASARAITDTVGDMVINDVSTQSRPGGCRIESAGILIADGSGGVVTGTSPMTWANTDTMQLDITYQTA